MIEVKQRRCERACGVFALHKNPRLRAGIRCNIACQTVLSWPGLRRCSDIGVGKTRLFWLYTESRRSRTADTIRIT